MDELEAIQRLQSWHSNALYVTQVESLGFESFNCERDKPETDYFRMYQQQINATAKREDHGAELLLFDNFKIFAS